MALPLRTLALVSLLLVALAAPTAATAAPATDAGEATTVTARFTNDSITNGHSQSTTTLDVETSASTVTLSATRNDRPVPAATLVELFGDEGLVSARGDAAEYAVPGDEASFRADFTEEYGGSYNVTVRADGAEATASVTVFDVGHTFSFAEASTAVARGGVAEITVATPGPEANGTLVVGSEDTDYRATMVFADGGDDRVTVRFNTFAAGNDSLNVVSAGNATDEVRLVTQTEHGPLLAAGDYRLTVWSGNDSDSTPQRAGFSTLTIANRGNAPTPNLSVAAAPGSIPRSMATDAAGPLGPDDAVAMSDWAVVDLRGPAVEGIVAGYGGLGAAAESSALRLEVEQTNPTPSCARRRLRLGETEPALAPNRTTLLLRATTAEFDADGACPEFCPADPEPGDRYEVRFAVTDDRLVESANGSVREFGVVEGNTSLGRDSRTVPAESNVTITGNTTYAPGTTFSVAASSVENATPRFEQRTTATVGPGGHWRASFDLTDRSPGSRLVVRSVALDGGFRSNASVVAPPPTPTATPTPTPEPTATSPATATRTPTGASPTAETSTRTDGPGFGAFTALLALLGAGLAWSKN